MPTKERTPTSVGSKLKSPPEPLLLGHQEKSSASAASKSPIPAPSHGHVKTPANGSMKALIPTHPVTGSNGKRKPGSSGDAKSSTKKSKKSKPPKGMKSLDTFFGSAKKEK